MSTPKRSHPDAIAGGALDQKGSDGGPVHDYALFLLDPHGNVVSWSAEVEQITGYASVEIVGRSYAIFFSADDRAAGIPEARLERAAAQGSLSDAGWRVRKDGTRFWVSAQLTALKDDDAGAPRGFVTVIQDLSHRLSAAAALQESELRYLHLFNVISDPLFVYDRETLGYLAVNDSAVRTYEYSRAEFLGMTIKDIRPVEDVAALLEMLAVSPGGLEQRGVWRHQSKSGDIMEVEISAQDLDYGGRPACLIQARDVTRKRRAEAEARRNSELLHAIADNATDALSVKDCEGKYLLFNAAAARHFGKAATEVLGSDDTALLSAEDARTVMTSDRLAIAGGSHTVEEVIVAGGAPRTFEATKVPYLDIDGKVLGVIGIARDVTERKRTEELERQSQTLLRIAGRMARFGGWSLDLDSQTLFWSDEIRTIHDVCADYQPTLESAIHFYSPEKRDLVASAVQRCIDDGAPFDFEVELVTATGRRRWVRSIGEAARDQTGRIVAVRGAFQDVSDLKHEADERKALAERLATTLETMSDAFVTLDADWRITYVNAAAERVVLRNREQLLGVSIWDAFPETLGSEFERSYRRARAERIPVEFKAYFAPLQGWFGVRVQPTSEGLALYFRDVTEIHLAEEQVRRSEVRFRLLSKATSDAVWEWDMVTGAHAWNDGVESLFGYPQEAIDPRIDFRLQRIHPDDVERINAVVEGAIASGAESWSAEYRFRHRDGSYKPVLDSGYIIRDAGGQAIQMLGGMKDLSEQRRMEQWLLLRDRAIQQVSQGIVICDARQPDNPVIFASAGIQRMTGYREDELLGRNCRILQGPETDPDGVRTLREAVEAGRGAAVELLNYRKDGTTFWNAMSIDPARDERGELAYFVGVQSDITERRELEAQLRQSQKMEAMGRLAGGVAHDFNNLLTIICGHSELLLSASGVSAAVTDSALEISKAGDRAAALTRQLLGFSRKSLLQPKLLDLNAVVSDTAAMLSRLMGSDIDFSTVLDPLLSPVKVDPSHLDQVLMNLAVNARDAMPSGGKLILETSNVLLSDDYAATHLDCKSGHHVLLSISDTGSGIKPELMPKIFEPFFTTKSVGKGTGLGLAVVHGIVQQSGGCIHVYSEFGRGTTFKVYLPAAADSIVGIQHLHEPSSVAGSETILLVEDEAGVRGLALASLVDQGYTVLAATDGTDALRIARAHCGPLDLILSDVVMPNLGGPELVSLLKEIVPQARVLFMSGYADSAVVRSGLLDASVDFIAKPFTPMTLARRVREVLDRPEDVSG